MADLEHKEQEAWTSGQQTGQISQEGQNPQPGLNPQPGQNPQSGQNPQPGLNPQPGQAMQGFPVQYPPMGQPGQFPPQGWVPQGQQVPYYSSGWQMPGQPGQPGVQPGLSGMHQHQAGAQGFRAGYPSPSPQWAPYAQPQTGFPQGGPYPGYPQTGTTGSSASGTDKAASRQQPAGVEAGDRYEDLKTAPFYNERYRKPGKGRMKGLVGPMIAIDRKSVV